ncbi:MAG: Sulfate adenylyltransferase subunit 1, partial [uncultured Corynebacteriales bacterium]
GPPPVRHRGFRRRRQEHPDRPAAVRHQVDLLRPAGGGGAHQPGPRRRVHQPGAAHRRAAGRARAGHHDRRRVPLLRHPAAEVHHRRHPGAPAVHPQHGHRRLHRRPGDRAGRRPEGAAGAEPAARVPGLAARRPAHRGRDQQDGPGRLGRGRLRAAARGVHRLRREARRQRRDGDPDLRAQRGQRGDPLGRLPLVRRAVPAAPPRERARRQRPQPHRRPLPGAVRDPPAVQRAPGLPRLRRHRGRRRAQAGRRRAGAAQRADQPDRRDRDRPRAGRRGVRADVGDGAPGGRPGRLPGRHALPAEQRGDLDPGRRGDGVLDDRPAAAAGRQAGDQAHHPDGAGGGPRAALPAGHQHAAPGRGRRRAGAQRHRPDPAADHPAAVPGRVPPQPHHRRLHPGRRDHERDRRRRHGDRDEL